MVMKMASRKNMYQQYGAIPQQLKGKDIWARNEAHLGMNISVYCKSCGKTIEMPSSEGPGSSPDGMNIYQMELQHQIHRECARELDKRGINY